MTADFGLVEREVDPSTQVIELEGQVDLYSAPEFKERSLAAIEAGKVDLIIDLTRATFVDSTALGVLVGALRRVRPMGGSVTVVSADDRIRTLFEITGLERAFTIEPTQASALERAKRAAGDRDAARG